MLRLYKSMFQYMLFNYIEDNQGGGSGDGDGVVDDVVKSGTGDGDVADGEGDGDGSVSFPDNWRELIAKGDEKTLKQLGRYASPNEIWNKAKSLEQRMSSGELKSVTKFPDDGTDKEKTAWRTENGVPEESKYDLTLPEGFVIGDADQPAIDSFMEFAHKNNMKTEDVSAAVNWYFNNQETQAEARSDIDAEFQTRNTDELRTEWGDQYRGNVNRINGLLDTAPKEVKEAIMGARRGDGNALASDAGVLRFLAQLAHEINPVTTLVPGSGANAMNALSDEIDALEIKMSDRQSDYWKGPTAEKNQERYRKLVAAREKAA